MRMRRRSGPTLPRSSASCWRPRLSRQRRAPPHLCCAMLLCVWCGGRASTQGWGHWSGRETVPGEGGVTQSITKTRCRLQVGHGDRRPGGGRLFRAMERSVPAAAAAATAAAADPGAPTHPQQLGPQAARSTAPDVFSSAARSAAAGQPGLTLPATPWSEARRRRRQRAAGDRAPSGGQRAGGRPRGRSERWRGGEFGFGMGSVWAAAAAGAPTDRSTRGLAARPVHRRSEGASPAARPLSQRAGEPTSCTCGNLAQAKIPTKSMPCRHTTMPRCASLPTTASVTAACVPVRIGDLRAADDGAGPSRCGAGWRGRDSGLLPDRRAAPVLLPSVPAAAPDGRPIHRPGHWPVRPCGTERYLTVHLANIDNTRQNGSGHSPYRRYGLAEKSDTRAPKGVKAVSGTGEQRAVLSKVPPSDSRPP